MGGDDRFGQYATIERMPLTDQLPFHHDNRCVPAATAQGSPPT